MIFPINHLAGTTKQNYQPNYNINNLNDTYRQLLTYSSKTKHYETKEKKEIITVKNSVNTQLTL